MTTRRDFLRISAMAAGCVISFPRDAFGADEEGKLIFGVQLYMVRRQAVTDLAGILKAIQQIGYTQIELSPMVYNHPAEELKKIVADSGLGLVSAHFDYVGFADKIGYAQELGLKYMVCPMLPQDQWTSTEGFLKGANDFNRWGRQVQDEGMEFVQASGRRFDGVGCVDGQHRRSLGEVGAGCLLADTGGAEASGHSCEFCRSGKADSSEG
jgi:hypothetical protein